MALKVGIVKSSEVSKWCQFKNTAGEVQAEFKIRGIAYKPFQVAMERAGNQITSKGYDVMSIDSADKLYHELLMDACAAHLIEDWKGVVFAEVVNDKTVETDMPYTAENASKLFNLGDIGISLWLFIKTEAQKIQEDADKDKAVILGKSLCSTNTKKPTRQKRRTKSNRSNS
ncbi:hypothetical protein F909_02590 [Acinetobacter sp. ANC 3929]|uniref:hypothetical protein n=1 Tax=unclassified Acinetobacter TaxID=196816 RepID=UPI0002CF8E7A|nr:MULTISPECIES: hypothetical protein [unclassified Acinetobacter]ENW81299.1 hypothetical protein F909_02590 [Acinetobacter sp. ANC 3929]MCH7354332.1 hypothetical protein [Acinetobacter sp. NIPH 1958]